MQSVWERGDYRANVVLEWEKIQTFSNFEMLIVVKLKLISKTWSYLLWAKISVREIIFLSYTNNSVKILTRKAKISEKCLIHTLQVAKEVFYIQDSQKCQSESNVLQIFRDSIVWKFLPSRVWFHGLNFHTLEKSWKNQVKTSNYWKMCNFQLL